MNFFVYLVWYMSKKDYLTVKGRVGAKYSGTCTCLYLSTFFRVLELQRSTCTCTCTQVTKYLVLEDMYIASTFSFVKKKYILELTFQLFSAIFFRT